MRTSYHSQNGQIVKKEIKKLTGTGFGRGREKKDETIEKQDDSGKCT